MAKKATKVIHDETSEYAVTDRQDSLEDIVRYFVDREWYTNSDDFQEQVFAVPHEVLEHWRQVVNGS